MKYFKFPYLLTALLAVIVVISCDKAFTVRSLTVYPSSLTTVVNDTSQLSFALVYEGGDYNDPNLIVPEWESSDSSIVSVNCSGVIISKAIGSAQITMTCGGVEGYCNVTVTTEETDTITE